MGDNVIDRFVMIRHWVLLLVGILGFSLAWIAVADETADEWGAWNQVPDDLLEMTDESAGLPLSQRLDQLARDERWEAMEGLLPEQALERWLGQWSAHGQVPAQSLDEVFQQMPGSVTPPGPPANLPTPAASNPGADGNRPDTGNTPDTGNRPDSANRPDSTGNRNPGRP